MIKVKCSYKERVSLKDIIPNPENPNDHSEEQIKELAENFEYQGIRHPIIVSKRSGFIAAGHARLLAAKLKKMKTFPVDYQDFDNDDKEYAFIVSDNGLALQAELDIDRVKLEIQNRPKLDIKFLGLPNLTGVMSHLRDDLNHDIEDVIPEKVKSRCKDGQLWILGEHRLLCGDSTEENNIKRLMGDEKADMVFTDPPYGMNLDTDYSKLPISPTGAKPKKWDPVCGDDTEFDPLFILSYFTKCPEIFLWGFDYYAYRLPKGTPLVWDKRVTENFDRMIGSAFELCWSKKKHKREICRLNNTLYSGEADAINKLHPTQKPLKVITWFFERYDGHNVVDLFGGSGSTLIACEKTKRKCYMMEIDPHYCSVIIERWENYTGQKAKKG